MLIYGNKDYMKSWVRESCMPSSVRGNKTTLTIDKSEGKLKCLLDRGNETGLLLEIKEREV